MMCRKSATLLPHMVSSPRSFRIAAAVASLNSSLAIRTTGRLWSQTASLLLSPTTDMSRISGYFDGGSSAQAKLFAEGLAQVMASAKPALCSVPQGAMAVAAAAVPAIAQKDACVAVVDG